MINMIEQKILFDTSSLLKLVINERGSEKVSFLMEQNLRKNRENLASTITVFEIVSVMAKRNIQGAVSAVSFFEKACTFLPPDIKIAQNAALMKEKYPEANLSLADAIILQTGIECN